MLAFRAVVLQGGAVGACAIIMVAGEFFLEHPSELTLRRRLRTPSHQIGGGPRAKALGQFGGRCPRNSVPGRP
jgi:hypothetical protein